MGIKTNHTHEQKTLTSSQDATLIVPTYGTITGMALAFRTGAGAAGAEADIRSEISNIRVSMSGRDIINASPTQILDMYEALGANVSTPAAIAGAVELVLGNLLFTDPVARDIFALGTKDQTSIQITVTAGTLVNIASVQVYTERTPDERNLGAHCKFLNYTQSFNSTGEHTVDSLPRDQNSAYLAVLVDDGASGTITHGEARRNSLTVKEKQVSAVNALFLSNRRQAQPSGYFVYSFCDGSLSSNLPMQGTTDFRLINTFSVAPGAAGYKVGALTVVNPPTAA